MVWGIAVLIISALVLFFSYIRKKERELEVYFQDNFSDKNIIHIDKHAIYRAQKSDRYSHTQGMGYLILTDRELFFKRQLGNKQVSIPLNSINKVGETKKLAGQSQIKPMLTVYFSTTSGKEDAVAWNVKELSRWKKSIQMRL